MLRLNHSLEASLLDTSSISSTSSGSSALPPPTSCKKGCVQALSKLTESFVSAGSHPMKEKQKRFASYPLTKKAKPAYRNIRGTGTIKHASYHYTTINITSYPMLSLHYNRTEPMASAECCGWVRESSLLSKLYSCLSWGPHNQASATA